MRNCIGEVLCADHATDTAFWELDQYHDVFE